MESVCHHLEFVTNSVTVNNSVKSQCQSEIGADIMADGTVNVALV